MEVLTRARHFYEELMQGDRYSKLKINIQID